MGNEGATREYDLQLYDYQVPGKTMSNYRFELARRGLDHRLEAMLDEIAPIRREPGYPIVVMPVSQYIGAQATLNHTTGERYRIVTYEVIRCLLGRYGGLAAPVAPGVKAHVIVMPRDREPLHSQPPATLLFMTGHPRQAHPPHGSRT